jgi:MoxR-like ATPase
VTALLRLRRELDRHVVAHDEAKTVLLLGLVCREHVYLEGPPGSAKTRLAEVAAAAAGLRFFFYQLHRDTRLAELVGDVVLERRPLADGAGERIHQRVEPGGILTAELCVLDDISRAPGEALNVLLRILNERKFGDATIPLRTAIATSNPLRDEYYNEPLDPANLDRFALQLRVESLIGAGDRTAARTLVDRFSEGSVAEHPEVAIACSREALDELHAALPRIVVPDAVKEALLDVFQRLVIEYGCNETNALLTDRSFLVKSVKLLRGRALLDGRERVELGDLDVLRWMTTFRVPPEVHEKVPELLARVIAAASSAGEAKG